MHRLEWKFSDLDHQHYFRWLLSRLAFICSIDIVCMPLT